MHQEYLNMLFCHLGAKAKFVDFNHEYTIFVLRLFLDQRNNLMEKLQISCPVLDLKINK